MRKFFLIFALVVPSFIYVICALSAGFDAQGAAVALAAQFQSKRQNMLFSTALNVFPVLLLIGLLWLYKKLTGRIEALQSMGWFGFLPIALVLIWTNLEVWPLFLPGRSYPGFPHGLEMIIGPGVFAPIGAVVGMVVGRLFSAKKTRSTSDTLGQGADNHQ